MCWIITTRQTTGEPAGSVFWSTPQLTLPAPTTEFHRVWPRESGNDAFPLDAQPSKAFYAPLGRVYYVGAWTQNMMFSEAKQFVQQVLPIPTLAFQVTAVAGPGVTGNAICFYRFFDQTHHRFSPLSHGIPVTLTNQKRSWTVPIIGLPSVFISHIDLMVSMDGQTPRLASRIERGMATFTEAVATLSLGEAAPDDFRDFPVCRYNEIWNYRQAMAGDAQHPDRVYLSALGTPEHYGGFFLRTLDGRAVTALVAIRENLFVFTADSSFIVTGFTDDDIRINYFEPGIGAISHHMTARFHDYAVIASRQQPYLCTGTSMHPWGTEYAQMWRQAYKDNQTEWERRGFAINDPEEEVVLINLNSAMTVNGEQFSEAQKARPVLDYSGVVPETSGGFSQPDLLMDVEARQVNCAAILGVSDGTRSSLFFGSEEGIVRRYNVATNVNDDSDSYGKAGLIRLGHNYLGEDGGDEWDAKHFQSIWTHCISEAASYDLKMWFGDDEAWRANPAQHPETVPAGAGTEPAAAGGDPLVPKTIHYSQPYKSGRGITYQIRQANAIFRWAGYGGTVTPGPDVREAINP